MSIATTQRHRSCPVCAGDNAVFLYSNAMSPVGGLDMSYRVSRCADCGFAYASELPDSATYTAYYRNLSKYDVMTSTAEIRPVDRVRMAAAVGLCAPHLAADALIEDIGCGTGALLNAFREAGWSRLHGIDPAPGAPARAEALFGLRNVRTGSLSQASEALPLDLASLVCLTGVLEHLPDLRADLSSLVAGMGRSAMILVEVPALERFIREPLEPYGEFSLEHIQFFSTQSLVRLMAELGYACLAHNIVTLSGVVTDSLFGLFVRQDALPAERQRDPVDLHAYIELSEKKMRQVIDRINNCTAKQLVIYGAGSHSARLLPRLEAAGISDRIVGIVDGNPNLLGQIIGLYKVCSPNDLAQWPEATIVISSFGAQEAIAEFVSRKFPNPILRLYS
jgi:SAM-dependent methyltransferase